MTIEYTCYEAIQHDERLAHYFVLHLQRNHCSEIFAFLQAANEFKELKENISTRMDAFRLQMTIIERFIRMNSELELNIPDCMRDGVLESHEEYGMDVPDTLFGDLELYCHGLLKDDQFNSFLESQFHREYKSGKSASKKLMKSLSKFLSGNSSNEPTKKKKSMLFKRVKSFTDMTIW
jgi:hypothetical protein